MKSDYFQWKKIDDFSKAAVNLLTLVFFDVLSSIFTCLVAFFICRINLIQVTLTDLSDVREALNISGVAACHQGVWVGFCNPSNLLA